MIVLARVGIMAFSTPCERARAVLDASIACKKSDPSCLQHQEPRTPPRTATGELCLTDFPGRCPGLSTFGAFSADSIKRCRQNVELPGEWPRSRGSRLRFLRRPPDNSPGFG